MSEVESSDIAAINYNPHTEVLEVTFRKSGKTVKYLNVGSLIYQGLITAKSKGKYFAKYIKNNYRPIH